MELEIKRITMAELEGADNIEDLLAGYEESARFDGRPKSNPDFEAYRGYEQSGFFHVIGAYTGDVLCGFVTLVITVLPHYSIKFGITESVFVDQKYRKTGAGLKLIHAAEKMSAELGALDFLMSAPVESDLAFVLPKIGFTPANISFYKRLPDE